MPGIGRFGKHGAVAVQDETAYDAVLLLDRTMSVHGTALEACRPLAAAACLHIALCQDAHHSKDALPALSSIATMTGAPHDGRLRVAAILLIGPPSAPGCFKVRCQNQTLVSCILPMPMSEMIRLPAGPLLLTVHAAALAAARSLAALLIAQHRWRRIHAGGAGLCKGEHCGRAATGHGVHQCAALPAPLFGALGRRW
jgi:hypothetical protein